MKEPSPKLIRWMDLINRFRFDVIHIDGDKNIIADMFRDSRFEVDWDVKEHNGILYLLDEATINKPVKRNNDLNYQIKIINRKSGNGVIHVDDIKPFIEEDRGLFSKRKKNSHSIRRNEVPHLIKEYEDNLTASGVPNEDNFSCHKRLQKIG
ncbi:hypothetical protein ACTA71_011828 [Dictyostelium dimigraforme]